MKGLVFRVSNFGLRVEDLGFRLMKVGNVVWPKGMTSFTNQLHQEGSTARVVRTPDINDPPKVHPPSASLLSLKKILYRVLY